MRMGYSLLLLTIGHVPLTRLVAHHSPGMLYDLSREIIVVGVVTEYQLGNPHMRIYLDVDWLNIGHDHLKLVALDLDAIDRSLAKHMARPTAP